LTLPAATNSFPAVAYSVVCISATDGAAGEDIAPLVADRLGFRLVDEQIVARAAQEAGVEPAVVADVEQRKSLVARVLENMPSAGMAGAGLALVGPPPVIEATPAGDQLRGLIQSAIEVIAHQGDAVIIAHAASLALATEPDVLRAFVTASPEMRAKRMAAARECDEKEAAKIVSRGDANRADYIKRFYGIGSEQTTHYDLLVNTDRLGAEQAADVIVHAARA
jgi:Cytidylate kinase-like family